MTAATSPGSAAPVDGLAAIAPLYLDHLAVTSSDLEAALADYLGLAGSRLLRGPADNPGQGVRYAFVQLAGGVTIEILAPLGEHSPITAHLARGGGAYHLCYAVADLATSIERATAAGARMVAPPTPDPAFDQRPVAFLLLPHHGLVELVAATPQPASANDDSLPCPLPTAASVAGDPGSRSRLDHLLLARFPSLKNRGVSGAALGVTAEWDSAGHLSLMMALEEEFGLSLTVGQIGQAVDYTGLLELVGEPA